MAARVPTTRPRLRRPNKRWKAMNKLNKNVTLKKEYKGKSYTLIVKDGKLTLGNKGKSFRSLSGAAEHITGHPTSGRYFWGIAK